MAFAAARREGALRRAWQRRTGRRVSRLQIGRRCARVARPVCQAKPSLEHAPGDLPDPPAPQPPHPVHLCEPREEARDRHARRGEPARRPAQRAAAAAPAPAAGQCSRGEAGRAGAPRLATVGLPRGPRRGPWPGGGLLRCFSQGAPANNPRASATTHAAAHTLRNRTDLPPHTAPRRPLAWASRCGGAWCTAGSIPRRSTGRCCCSQR